MCCNVSVVTATCESCSESLRDSCFSVLDQAGPVVFDVLSTAQSLVLVVLGSDEKYGSVELSTSGWKAVFRLREVQILAHVTVSCVPEEKLTCGRRAGIKSSSLLLTRAKFQKIHMFDSTKQKLLDLRLGYRTGS